MGRIEIIEGDLTATLDAYISKRNVLEAGNQIAAFPISGIVSVE
jgi:hypothetical protein